MTARKLPPCGIYRTSQEVGGVPADRLVYFHNHGEPGPGIYLPERWEANRARFQRRGFTLPAPAEEHVGGLEPLVEEGFYRVVEAFHCCDERCREYEPDLLVQLGYDGEGRAILFLPEITASGMAIPEMGTRIEADRIARLRPLRVVRRKAPDSVGHDQVH